MNVACIVCFSKYNYMNRGSLTFEPLTLVPIQVKMINTDMLTQKEVREKCFHPSFTMEPLLFIPYVKYTLGREG